ncbi:glycosyltransferase family 39 protein [Clostridium sp. JNZ X4-2]
MERILSKKGLFKIILIFLVFLSLLLCLYSIKNYKFNTPSQNMTRQFNQFNGNTGDKVRNQNSTGERNNGSFAGRDRKISGSNSQGQNKNNGNFTRGDQKVSGGNSQNQTKNAGNLTAPSGDTQNQNKGGNMTRPGVKGENRFVSSNNKFAPFLTVYLAVFLVLCVTFYYFFIRKNMKTDAKDTKMLIFSMLLIGLLLRITLSTLMEGYGGDVSLFKSWASSAANSFSQFYINSKSSDYPPLYIYVLFLIGKTASISSVSPYYTLLLKLPSIIADVATAYLIYKLARKYLPLEISVFLSAFYIFNPAVFIDSALWGQVDSFFTLFVVLAFLLLSEKKTVFSSILFTCSVLMKPQGIIFLPVLLFELVREKSLKLLLKSIAAALAAALIIIIPFSFNQNILWIFKLYSNTISEYPYASVNGLNFFNLTGANYEKNSSIFFIFSYKIWGMAAIIAITLFSWIIYAKLKSRTMAFSCALVQISGVFTFSTGMHERYLFPAAALCILAFIYLKDKRFLTLLLGYTITIYGNIYHVLFGALGRMNSNSHSLITDGISLLNIILFFYLAKILMDIAFKGKTYAISGNNEPLHNI